MPLFCPLHQLQQHSLDFRGELTAAELELEDADDLIHFRHPLRYDLRVELIGRTILVNGCLQVALDCECARCLSAFQEELSLEEWSVVLPLEGQDKVPVQHDSVDLTPCIREDILLALPQHPLCRPDCTGLTHKSLGRVTEVLGGQSSEDASSAWAKLNKLKL
jgi:uncharacterized protein